MLYRSCLCWLVVFQSSSDNNSLGGQNKLSVVVAVMVADGGCCCICCCVSCLLTIGVGRSTRHTHRMKEQQVHEAHTQFITERFFKR